MGGSVERKRLLNFLGMVKRNMSEHRERNDQNMETDYTKEERRFDAFCRKVIRNESKDGYRENARRMAKEVPLLGETQTDLYRLHTEDHYTTYERIYYVGDIKVAVHDEDLGNVLQFIIPARRNVILLNYLLGLKDKEVAERLNISTGTVAYRRKKAFVQIKDLMEARKNGNY